MLINKSPVRSAARTCGAANFLPATTLIPFSHAKSSSVEVCFCICFRHIYSLFSVPWDVSEDALLEAFSPYGRCKVEWPGNEARFARPGQRGGTITRGKVGYLFFSSILFYFFQVTGYVYMIFDHEHSVRHLLRDCSQVVVSHFQTI